MEAIDVLRTHLLLLDHKDAKESSSDALLPLVFERNFKMLVRRLYSEKRIQTADFVLFLQLYEYLFGRNKLILINFLATYASLQLITSVRFVIYEQ